MRRVVVKGQMLYTQLTRTASKANLPYLLHIECGELAIFPKCVALTYEDFPDSRYG